MLCLGIETSCDETAVALVEDGRLLGERLSSQADMHAVFGGVVPELASREHLRVLHSLVDEILAETNISIQDLDGVCAVRGPGLLGSLLVGLAMAKTLAIAGGARLVGVNHLWAHLLAAGIERELSFPALGLLVSGGHTQIYHIRSELDFQLLGRTLDDAAGEAFDKTAKLLNFPYPGGVLIDKLASMTVPDESMFPRPYLDNQNMDFSFSGLKTAVVHYLEKHPELKLPSMPSEKEILDNDQNRELQKLCASLNWSVVDTLRVKMERALKQCPEVKSVIVAGGVAANSMLRETMTDLCQRKDLEIILPSPALCTDNAAMVAYTGYLLLRSGWEHALTVDAIPRGRKIPFDYVKTRNIVQQGS